LTFSFVLSSA